MAVDDDLVVKVFTVEMVFVPSGTFEVGFRETAAGIHTGGFITYGTGAPYKITKEDSIPVGQTAGSLWLYNNGANAPGFTSGLTAIPDSFPKGYKAFYMMKYELTQNAFAEMLNSIDVGAADLLTPGVGGNPPFPINSAPVAYSEVNRANAGYNYGHVTQDAYPNVVNHYGSGRIILAWIKGAGGAITYGCDGNRNCNGTIATLNETRVFDTVKIGGKEYVRYVSVDGQDIPMHICSPYMLAAYAGFAGLRPMTEFEYEKACRGPVNAKANEYAWGSSEGTAGDYFIEQGRWDVAGGNANSVYKNINRGNEKLASSVSGFGVGGIELITPSWWAGIRYRQSLLIRVGAFADTNTTRQGSGASYWGIMNLSDNAYEYTVLATATAGGLQYNGEHGNGILIFDAAGVYPDGKNTWRLPTNTTGWWSVRGIYLYPLLTEIFFENCSRPQNPASRGWGLQGNGILSDRGTGYVGKRSLGGTGYTSQKNTALFAGIRCVRTADTVVLK